MSHDFRAMFTIAVIIIALAGYSLAEATTSQPCSCEPSKSDASEKRYVITSRDVTQHEQVSAILEALQGLDILTTADASTCFSIDDIIVTSPKTGSSQEVVLSVRQLRLESSQLVPAVACPPHLVYDDVTTTAPITSNTTVDDVSDSNATVGGDVLLFEGKDGLNDTGINTSTLRTLANWCNRYTLLLQF